MSQQKRQSVSRQLFPVYLCGASAHGKSQPGPAAIKDADTTDADALADPADRNRRPIIDARMRTDPEAGGTTAATRLPDSVPRCESPGKIIAGRFDMPTSYHNEPGCRRSDPSVALAVVSGHFAMERFRRGIAAWTVINHPSDQ